MNCNRALSKIYTIGLCSARLVQSPRNSVHSRS